MEHFYQNCTPQINYQEFYSWMVSQAPSFAHFVEVGCWKGGSAAYMSVEIARSGKNIIFDCVDTWLGNECHQLGQIYEEPDVVNQTLFDVFKSNMMPALGLFRIRRGTSVEVATQYPDKSLDFVFIDAEHTYEAVRDDIHAWVPKIKSGGILAGHDYMDPSWPGVTQAVNELLPQAQFYPPTCWWYKQA